MPPPAPRHIRSRQNALVDRFREAARRSDGADGEALIEGLTLIEEAHRAGLTVTAAAFADDTLAEGDSGRVFERLAGVEDRVTVSRNVLDAMSPARTPSGAVALARPPAWRIEDVLHPAPPLVIVAVDVQDPGNLGAIVRAAEAAGATGVVAAGTSADPFGWKAIRGAMGSAFRLPLLRSTDVDACVGACRAGGLQIVATTRDGVSLDACDLRRPTAVLVGAEGSGLPTRLVDTADARLAIPMRPPVESLNVAVAAAIVLYEARRQRLQAGAGAWRADGTE